jgi:hypothetical protein
MNLQENIERIHEIMGGVITEDRMDKVIKNMINTIGLESTFKMIGDYDLVEKYLTDKDKINFIEKVVNVKSSEAGVSGLSTYELDILPVLLDKDGDRVREISYFTEHGVLFDVYVEGDRLIDTQSMTYEMLPTDVLDNVFILMLDLLERK